VNHLPLIVVEVLLVFGGALAFAWWQFRDLRLEREKREKRNQETRDADGGAASPSTKEPDDVQ
jgi:cytoskeletal protein RodZ